MARLCLRLLGTPEIQHGESAVVLPTRKALALLAYLAVEGGLHPRERLAALLWPEGDETRSRGSLRRALASLREALNDEHLRSERGLLGLAPAELELDVRTLEESLSPASQSDARGDEAATQRLRTAVRAFRGEFLAGIALPDAPDMEAWLAALRGWLRLRAEEACERLSRLLQARGEAPEAIAVLERWLAIEPTAEAAWRRLMETQAAAGEPQAALRSFDACRETLRRELDLEPEPETVALAERLRAGLRNPRSIDGQAQRSSGVARLIEAPLVGRAAEHAELVAAYEHALRGVAQGAVIEGEAGIGKSRLVDEFASWAASRGADVLRCRVFEAGGRVPYQPLVEMLRPRLERENAPEDLLADVWLVELSRLLPELRERYPDLPAPTTLDEEAARARLFEAVARLLQALARSAPLLVLVDDLQWADAATLDLLRYAGRRLAESGVRVLTLLAVRSEALAEDASLAAWVAAAVREQGFTRLALGPLSPDATRRLLLALAEEDSGAAAEPLAAALQSETGGQPLFVMETLKALVERGALSVSSRSGRLDLAGAHAAARALRGLTPPGVRDVVRGRLARLAPAAVTVLAAAAVLGRAATFEQLCAVAELDENQALPALDALIAARLLREAAGEDVTYLFAHDRIRDVVYADAGEARRRVFHRRALAALERASAPAAELAQHAAGARLTWPAVRYGLAAGDEAMRVFAVRDAAGYYEQARRALLASAAGEAARDLDWRERERLYLQLGRARELLAEHDAAREVYAELLAAAGEAALPIVECAALSRLALIEVQQWVDLEHAVELLHQALDAAERSGDPLTRAECEWNLAQLHFYRWESLESLPHGRRALALARELGHEDLTARALNVISYVLVDFPGDWEEGGACAAEAAAIQQRLGNRALEADCLGLVTQACIHLARLDDAIAAGERMLAIAERIENTWGRLNAAFHTAQALLEAGRWGEALRLAQQGVAIARAGAWSPLVALNLITLGHILRAQRDFEGARALHEEAKRVGDATPWNHFAELADWELALDCAQLGDTTRALALIQEARHRRQRAPFWVILRSAVEEVELLLAAGERATAEAEIERFRRAAVRSERYRIEYLRGLAALQRWDHQPGPAAASLREALATAERLRLPASRFEVAAALARLLAECGDAQAAQARVVADAAAGALAAAIDDQAARERFRARASML